MLQAIQGAGTFAVARSDTREYPAAHMRDLRKIVYMDDSFAQTYASPLGYTKLSMQSLW